MLAIRDLCLPHKLHFKTRILCHQKRYILFLYSIFNARLRRMMVLSGAWGDREGIFLLLFLPRRVSACEVRSGESWQSPADRFKGGGRDQSEGHGAQRSCMCGKRLLWESHGRADPWRCQVPHADQKSPFHRVYAFLCSLPSPTHPVIAGKCFRVRAVFGYPGLYPHGVVSLALTGPASRRFVTSAAGNCSNLTLGHPGLWAIGTVAL